MPDSSGGHGSAKEEDSLHGQAGAFADAAGRGGSSPASGQRAAVEGSPGVAGGASAHGGIGTHGAPGPAGPSRSPGLPPPYPGSLEATARGKAGRTAGREEEPRGRGTNRGGARPEARREGRQEGRGAGASPGAAKAIRAQEGGRARVADKDQTRAGPRGAQRGGPKTSRRQRPKAAVSEYNNININFYNAKNAKNNYISSCKYTWWNFIFLFLMQEYQRPSNIYYLFVLVCNFIPSTAVMSFGVMLFPVVFVLVASAIREIIEDVLRLRSDLAANGAEYDCIREGAEARVRSCDLRQGDLVRVSNGQEVPADCLLFYSSSPARVVHVTTANLDGESNPKPRHAVLPFSMAEQPEREVTQALRSLWGRIRAYKPNSNLTLFTGKCFYRLKLPYALYAQASETAFAGRVDVLPGGRRLRPAENSGGRGEGRELESPVASGAPEAPSMSVVPGVAGTPRPGSVHASGSILFNSPTQGASSPEAAVAENPEGEEGRQDSRDAFLLGTALEEEFSAFPVASATSAAPANSASPAGHSSESVSPSLSPFLSHYLSTLQGRPMSERLDRAEAWEPPEASGRPSSGGPAQEAGYASTVLRDADLRSFLASLSGFQAGDQLPPATSRALRDLERLRALAEAPDRQVPELRQKLAELDKLFYAASGEVNFSRTVSFGTDSILLRGMRLVNTDYCYGAIIYTGEETRLRMNQTKTPPKKSRIQRRLDILVIYIVIAQFIYLFALAAVAAIRNKSWLASYPYSGLNATESDWMVFLNRSISFLILTNYAIPISMFVVLEFLQIFQGIMIEMDMHLRVLERVPHLARGRRRRKGQAGRKEAGEDQDNRLALGDEHGRASGEDKELGSADHAAPADLADAVEEYPAPKVHCCVKSTNLLGDLAEVDLIFSDKTGTITSNQMVFHSYFSLIDGHSVCHSDVSRGLGSYASLEVGDCVSPLLSGGEPPRSAINRPLLFAMALCHTITPQKTTRGVTLQGESTDEVAFARAAWLYGLGISERGMDAIKLEYSFRPSVGRAQSSAAKLLTARLEYRIHALIPFSSLRKRMSIILQERPIPVGSVPGLAEFVSANSANARPCGSGMLRFDQFTYDPANGCAYFTPAPLSPVPGSPFVIAKGADSFLLPVCAEIGGVKPHRLPAIASYCNKFGTDGLRTLAWASSPLTPVVLAAWKARWDSVYQKGEAAPEYCECAAGMEGGLDFLALTAVEDKLADDVPVTLASFIKAGIKVWLLTGDKTLTAVNIAKSSNLAPPGSKWLYFTTDEISSMVDAMRGDGELTPEQVEKMKLEALQKLLNTQKKKVMRYAIFRETQNIFNRKRREMELNRLAGVGEGQEEGHHEYPAGDMSRHVTGPDINGFSRSELAEAVQVSDAAEGGEMGNGGIVDRGVAGAVGRPGREPARDVGPGVSVVSGASAAPGAPGTPHAASFASPGSPKKHKSSVKDPRDVGSLSHLSLESRLLLSAAKDRDEELNREVERGMFLRFGVRLRDVFSTKELYGLKNSYQTSRPFVTVLDGETFRLIYQHGLHAAFLKIALNSGAVICCRLSPEEKALVVSLTRQADKNLTTLAIGDGANDCPMIKAANIGVGIAGNEGMHAANSSDFSLPAFRFLRRLLFVHGHYCHVRTTELIEFNIYKNVVIVLVNSLFSEECLYTVQLISDDFLLAFYNIIYTLFIVFIYALAEKDVRESVLETHPDQYRKFERKTETNVFTICFQFLSALWHSVCIYYGVTLGFAGNTPFAGGDVSDLRSFSYLILTAMFLIGTGKSLIIITYWNYALLLACALTLLIFMVVYVSTSLTTIFTDGVYGTIQFQIGSANGWLICAAVCLAALAPDLAYYSIRKFYAPYSYHILNQMACKPGSTCQGGLAEARERLGAEETRRLGARAPEPSSRELEAASSVEAEGSGRNPAAKPLRPLRSGLGLAHVSGHGWRPFVQEDLALEAEEERRWDECLRRVRASLAPPVIPPPGE